VFVRKNSRIFGTLFFLLRRCLRRSGVGTRAPLSGGTRGSSALFFPDEHASRGMRRILLYISPADYDDDLSL